MFYHLTYDGAVNIDSVPDPAMKAAILAQINHFGQTPRQLFAKPHPKRRWVPRPTLSLVPYSYHTVVPQVAISSLPTLSIVFDFRFDVYSSFAIVHCTVESDQNFLMPTMFLTHQVLCLSCLLCSIAGDSHNGIKSISDFILSEYTLHCHVQQGPATTLL